VGVGRLFGFDGGRRWVELLLWDVGKVVVYLLASFAATLLIEKRIRGKLEGT
jgi:hypothetical protein